MTPSPAEFKAIEARLWSILEPYRDRLDAGSVYLMPVYTDPHLLDGVSPGLRRRLKGKTTFDFTEIDEALFADLEVLTGRCFEAYASGHGD